jgi:cobyrinic acid a,c-diamide synthase
LGKLPQHAAGLDGWLLSPDAARAAFHSLSAGADISLIEGCLGMFDGPGADGSEQGSTAQVTQWLQAPVVLVIDAQAFKSARGIVALVKGYTAVDGGLGVAGVILNKVSNKALIAELADGLKAAGLDVTVLGGVPKVGNRGLMLAQQQQHSGGIAGVVYLLGAVCSCC